MFTLDVGCIWCRNPVSSRWFSRFSIVFELLANNLNTSSGYLWSNVHFLRCCCWACNYWRDNKMPISKKIKTCDFCKNSVEQNIYHRSHCFRAFLFSMWPWVKSVCPIRSHVIAIWSLPNQIVVHTMISSFITFSLLEGSIVNFSSHVSRILDIIKVIRLFGGVNIFLFIFNLVVSFVAWSAFSFSPISMWEGDFIWF